MRDRSRQSRLIESLKRDFEDRQKPEGFYLTKGHERKVRRLLQQLYSPSPFSFIHSASHSLSTYYYKIVTERLRISSLCELIYFDSLSSKKILDVINGEIGNIPLERISSLSERNANRKVLLIPSSAELSEENWQDIETICSSLPGSDIGILCAVPVPTRIVSLIDRLTRNKRVFHAYFDVPRPKEKLFLSAIARSSSGHRNALQVLKDLDLYEPNALGSTQDSGFNDSSKESTPRGSTFSDHLQEVELGTAIEEPSVALKSVKYYLAICTVALFLVGTISYFTLL